MIRNRAADGKLHAQGQVHPVGRRRGLRQYQQLRHATALRGLLPQHDPRCATVSALPCLLATAGGKRAELGVVGNISGELGACKQHVIHGSLL